MVRVSGVAATASSWTKRTSNRIVSAIPTSHPSRRDVYLPHRSRRQKKKLSFAFMGFGMLVAFAVLQWYLLSILAIRKIDPSDKPKDYYGSHIDPFATTCPDEPTKDICFLTCIFGDAVETVDLPANVEWFNRYWCHTRFLLVTNLEGLPAPGWTKVVANTTTNDMHQNNMARQQTNIVLSRHAKFLAWDALPEIVPQECAAVVYMDGYLAPIRFQSWWNFLWALTNPPWSPASPLFVRFTTTQVPPPRKFQNVVRQVREHPWGLSQVKQKYFDGLPMTKLLNNLVRDRKDTKEHVENTLSWFRSQESDGAFEEIMPYYLNKYFAYDPSNAKYRELSSSFWKTYTTYGGVWRDQPLWAYFLHRFNVTPAVMTTEGTITKGGDLFQTKGKLGWDKHVYT